MTINAPILMQIAGSDRSGKRSRCPGLLRRIDRRPTKPFLTMRTLYHEIYNEKRGRIGKGCWRI